MQGHLDEQRGHVALADSEDGGDRRGRIRLWALAASPHRATAGRRRQAQVDSRHVCPGHRNPTQTPAAVLVDWVIPFQFHAEADFFTNDPAARSPGHVDLGRCLLDGNAPTGDAGRCNGPWQQQGPPGGGDRGCGKQSLAPRYRPHPPRLHFQVSSSGQLTSAAPHHFESISPEPWATFG